MSFWFLIFFRHISKSHQYSLCFSHNLYFISVFIYLKFIFPYRNIYGFNYNFFTYSIEEITFLKKDHFFFQFSEWKWVLKIVADHKFQKLE